MLTDITDLTPDFIRKYLLYLEQKGHNPGGIHAAYRSLKAFLNWYEDEVEPEDWKNPIKKVKDPKVAEDPLEPVELSDVKKMIKNCDTKTVTGRRDLAILLFLLDSGVRAGELLADLIKEADGDMIG